MNYDFSHFIEHSLSIPVLPGMSIATSTRYITEQGQTGFQNMPGQRCKPSLYILYISICVAYVTTRILGQLCNPSCTTSILQ